jgi:hypothetical protein
MIDKKLGMMDERGGTTEKRYVIRNRDWHEVIEEGQEK